MTIENDKLVKVFCTLIESTTLKKSSCRIEDVLRVDASLPTNHAAYIACMVRVMNKYNGDADREYQCSKLKYKISQWGGF